MTKNQSLSEKRFLKNLASCRCKKETGALWVMLAAYFERLSFIPAPLLDSFWTV